MEDTSFSNAFSLQVDNSNIPYLSEAAKWGKFLSILGFIIIIIVLCFGILAFITGNTFSPELDTQLQDMQLPGNLGGIIMGIYFLVISVLYFFPCLFLYNFSSRMQKALRSNDQILLNRSFSSLKSLFKFWGILTIVIMGFFILIIILAIVLGAAF
ncbi:MAG: hypothetical protein JO072_11010 [Parafilimonas sp.]|nr:hypothetical protein [Parafilimonas sp.]